MGILTGRVRLLEGANEIPGAPLYNDVAKLVKYADGDDYISVGVNSQGGLQVGLNEAATSTLSGTTTSKVGNTGYLDNSGNLHVVHGYVEVGNSPLEMEETIVTKSELDAAEWTCVWCVLSYSENTQTNNGYSVRRVVTHTYTPTQADNEYWILMVEYKRDAPKGYAKVYNQTDGVIWIQGVWL